MAKDLEDLPEGGERCFKCYEMRLRESAEEAKKGGFDYFTTTLSISPLKDAERLNSIGKQGKKYGVHGAFCLETQAIPNNVNVPEYQEFGSSFYKAGEVYHYITSYAFGLRK